MKPEPLTQLMVRVPPALHKRIKVEAAKRNLSVQELVTEAITAHLAQPKPKGSK